MVDLLIKLGADVNSKSGWGDASPLHIAASKSKFIH